MSVKLKPVTGKYTYTTCYSNAYIRETTQKGRLIITQLNKRVCIVNHLISVLFLLHLKNSCLQQYNVSPMFCVNNFRFQKMFDNIVLFFVP